MSRRAAVVVAIAAVIGAVLLSARILELGPWTPRDSSSVRRADGADRADRERREAARRLPAIRPMPHRSADAAATATTDAGPPPPRLKLAMLFDGECNFGVAGHCAEWSEGARRCDAGDADSCVRLGDLLITEAPAQPLWGSLFLERACDLGRDDACERGLRWNRWSRYGYSPAGADAGELPADLAAACGAGDMVACGLVEMRRARSESLDFDRALESCRWGFRDVCGIIAESAPRTAQAVAALKAGCESPDAWLCYHLSLLYTPGCVDSDRGSPCPPPDPFRAAHFKALACQLEPALWPCRAE